MGWGEGWGVMVIGYRKAKYPQSVTLQNCIELLHICTLPSHQYNNVAKFSARRYLFSSFSALGSYAKKQAKQAHTIDILERWWQGCTPTIIDLTNV